MDHEAAVRTAAVERYVLGEMKDDERDAFEEHYFSCPACAEAVRTAEALKGEMKDVLREGTFEKRRAWWFPLPVMIPAAAALALALLVVYQNAVVLPGLKAPRTVGPAVILDGLTRGAGPKIAAGGPLHFQMGLDGVTGSRVRVEIDRQGDGEVAGGVVAAPAVNQPLDIYFPGKFGAGQYVAVVRDVPGGREIARSSFDVVDQEAGTK
ncbi:MAG TPA: zf-HC2 domain-containing protein [Bryobacteraceae bacterium]|nr:zf-HC2 domain-containing protein [Bryobacteraceae bacterium]